VSRIVALTNVSLDGVMQAPGRADEDTRNGFTHGGWATPYQAMQHAGAAFASVTGLLLGRRTYEDFYAVWPSRPESPYTEYLNNIPKFVASKTLKEPLAWRNSTRVESVDAIEKLGADLLVLGSGELLHALARRNLVDQYIVLIHPIVLGTGLKLFPDGGPYASLQLVDSTKTDAGVVIATYTPKAV
jgi:dihydrofolate reductase